MQRHEKSALLGQTIREKAATADGFDVTDCPKGGTKKAAHQRCRLMIKAGTLFKGRASYRLIRYFDTAAAAAFVRANFASAAGQRAPVAVPLKAEKLTYAQVAGLRSASAKPKPQTAPRADAEVIHTARTRYSSRLMGPGRYAVSDLPMVRIGSAEWRAGVGA